MKRLSQAIGILLVLGMGIAPLRAQQTAVDQAIDSYRAVIQEIAALPEARIESLPPTELDSLALRHGIAFIELLAAVETLGLSRSEEAGLLSSRIPEDLSKAADAKLVVVFDTIPEVRRSALDKRVEETASRLETELGRKRTQVFNAANAVFAIGRPSGETGGAPTAAQGAELAERLAENLRSQGVPATASYSAGRLRIAFDARIADGGVLEFIPRLIGSVVLTFDCQANAPMRRLAPPNCELR